MSNLFEVRNLVYRYPKAKEDVIHSISFQVEEGTIFGLLGPSGAGKSTTQKIMIKLLSGYEGTITYRGKDLNQYGKEYYEEVGVGFEMPVHFNKLTAMENLQYFASLYHSHIDYEKLLRRVGLEEAKHQEVGQYSKGMKIRLNFVRAMLNQPKVLFLDEPTNGLDPRNAKIIKDLILEFKQQGGTVFITTHLMGDVEQLCDQVVFMTQGTVNEAASPRDLKLKYGTKEVYIEYIDKGLIMRKNYAIDKLGWNQEFMDLLRKYPVETIHSGETSLEEIFIRLTGEKRNE